MQGEKLLLWITSATFGSSVKWYFFVSVVQICVLLVTVMVHNDDVLSAD